MILAFIFWVANSSTAKKSDAYEISIARMIINTNESVLETGIIILVIAVHSKVQPPYRLGVI